jgi:hypothetical protein
LWTIFLPSQVAIVVKSATGAENSCGVACWNSSLAVGGRPFARPFLQSKSLKMSTCGASALTET